MESFRPMRRVKNERSPEEAEELLASARIGFLAVNGDNGYPYAVPVNFFYDREKNALYFHGAKEGQKADSLRVSDKACFTVCGEETPSDDWAPFVTSAVAFGRCRVMPEGEERATALTSLAEKYYPSREAALEEVRKAGNRVAVFELRIEHLTCKRVKEK